MGKIEIDLKKANQQADELERLANRLRQISRGSMGATLNNVSNSWECTNATNFCRKGQAVADNITLSADQLQKIANNIRVVAKRTYDAEKRVQEIAKQRTYKV